MQLGDRLLVVGVQCRLLRRDLFLQRRDLSGLLVDGVVLLTDEGLELRPVFCELSHVGNLNEKVGLAGGVDRIGYTQRVDRSPPQRRRDFGGLALI